MADSKTTSPRRVLIVAGEVSGDIHAANMLRELSCLDPSVSAFGVGGERLEAAGLELVGRTEELAHMGLIEVLRELPRIRGVMDRLVSSAERERPGLAVLVDSPDFNLRLAKKLRGLDIPVVLYVSPQLWAWRRGRVRTVKRLAREVLCILPFEVPFYRQHSVPARYVGHPLVDDISREGLLGGCASERVHQIALLPGSRSMEVRQLLPTMLSALEKLSTDAVRSAVLVEAPGVQQDVDQVLAAHRVDPRLSRVRGTDKRESLARSQLAWTASGTATLECALLDVPMIVGYRLQPVSYAIARLLVRVPHVALVNLIAEKRLATELLQTNWSPEALKNETLRLLDRDGIEAQRNGLQVVRERLGSEGASRRAAESVLEILRATAL